MLLKMFNYHTLFYIMCYIATVPISTQRESKLGQYSPNCNVCLSTSVEGPVIIESVDSISRDGPDCPHM